MSSQLIISIGREFGSAGHEIAQKLAEHYNIQLLDSNLLQEVAQEKNLDVKHLEGLDEKKRIKLFSRNVRGFHSSPEQNVSMLQFDFLRKKAQRGESFVIVGRCSESVLKGCDAMVSMFILGDISCKVKRIMELYHMDEDDAKKYIAEQDFKRKRYHNSFCKGKWGDSRNYDISINSSKLGVDETIRLLIDYIDIRRKK